MKKSTIKIRQTSNHNNNCLSDENLYKLCRLYGQRALEARRKFAGLLPEVYRRKLFEKKGFGSIYEFAAKLAGMSREQVDMVIRLEKKFDKMPVLKKALINGEVSANKLLRVASIANSKNEEEIFEKAKILPVSALNTFVKDVKQNGLFEAKNEAKSLYVQTFSMDDLSEELKEKLAELKVKGIDINKLLLGLLEKREEEIAKEKEKLADISQNSSRHVPMKVKKLIQKEHGNKCSVPNCHREAKTLHHTLPFAMGNSHDPRFLALLCDDHHKIAHLINVKYAEMRQ